MNRQNRATLINAGSGAIVAVVLVLAFDMPVSNAMIVLGLWIIAGAAMRILIEYVRVRRRARDLPES
ncbi:hypothetical protein [Demequina muriae]|uniref:Uncharacterized protein n=1 Tax=Demequina muriae TaxID=3051664 RepID=A0ABT8GE80_9MICO|nr:hypothetical protein [Demequina sp. EGI L300058]MDN4479738.1 hypothetical protein [Demequina sp. EGI L300058]